MQFPKCKIKGSYDPVPYGHLGVLTGCIPKKCSKCKFFFEGSCVRTSKQADDTPVELELDYGPCKVDGDTSPGLIFYELHVLAKLQVPTISELHVPKMVGVCVPKKCISCIFLSFHHCLPCCNFEREKWGDFPRALDWGNWSPDIPNVDLESGKIVSIDLIDAVRKGKKVKAIKIFRKINKGTSIKEARDAFNSDGQPINEMSLKVGEQLEKDLSGIATPRVKEIVIAYEPVWAIGTGNPCLPDDAMKAALFIKKTLSKLYNRQVAETVKILYGGSVTSQNAKDYIRGARMDRLLVGGASLNASEFITIIKSCLS